MLFHINRIERTYTFVPAAAGSWVALGVMHANRNRTKCFLKYIHTSRRREAKATSVHTDDQWALCLEVVKHGDVAAVLRSNNRREHGSSQWSCFSRLRGFFYVALGYSRGVTCSVTLSRSLITGLALPQSSGLSLMYSLCLQSFCCHWALGLLDSDLKSWRFALFAAKYRPGNCGLSNK